MLELLTSIQLCHTGPVDLSARLVAIEQLLPSPGDIL